ncbi:hypothetical protein N657DRAFT_653048 [Parathielavia appendiculata]|uniref:C2H2-type domain-containing protein n=1 Tax=Parathielavia appendiculata TaxID=2587402 RepID=A0AAN6UB63_9PEZI|nr:hypothetical protein N657DRAFT_653048 [Parathielavia appendiculata]
MMHDAQQQQPQQQQQQQQEEEEEEEEQQEGFDDHGATDSDELHETRPNRWRGHPSTWRLWTEADRQTWTSLENVRREDLAVHLYNAFGLRQGFRVGPVADEDGNEETAWDPGRAWTAWPMRADEVPDDGLLPRTVDVNEPFTLRRDQGQPFAGCNLEEEISATILRYAKEKFRKRDLQHKTGEVVVPSIETGDAATTTGGETDESDTAGTPARDDETDEPRKMPPRRKRRAAPPTFTPVISADDNRSYALLRPVARRIMARLDDTFMILHNQRMAGLGHMSESSASDEETDIEAVSEKPSQVPSPVPAKSPFPPKYRGGRPKKVHVPREGETEQEMLIRLARQGRRKIPAFSPADSEIDRGRSRSRSINRARRSVSAGSRASPRSAQSGSSVSSKSNRERLLKRWGLRDWRDVLGAAALAGFSPVVMARAAQRCATLFREEMTMHTLHERSTSDKVGLESTRYVPGGPLPSSSDDDDSEEELAQLRTVSRHSSVRLGASSPEPESEAPASRRSRSKPRQIRLCPHRACPRSVEGFTKKSNYERHLKAVHGNLEPNPTEPDVTEAETPTQRRSRSGTPGASHFCHYPNCPRAVEGFAKRANLARHLQTVHGKRAADFTEDEEDSADEMEGGLHVDRFLQPIKIRKGWRGEDTTQRHARSRKKARAGSEELDSAFL